MAFQSIEFEFIKNGHTFKDAIVLEENHGLSDEQIDAMKQARFDDWYAIVTAPTVED
jgi:hypothetical protein